MHAVALRPAHRPLLLAHAAAAPCAVQLRAAADRAGPPHAGLAAQGSTATAPPASASGTWACGSRLAGGAPLSLTRPLPWDGGPLPDRSLSERIDFTQPVGGGPTTLGFDEAFYTAGCSTDQEPYCFIEGDRCLGMERAAYRRPYGSWRSGMAAPDWDNGTVDLAFTERAAAFIDHHSRAAARTPDRERQPFFLYLPLSAPHSPHLPPELVRGASAAGPRGDQVALVDWCVGRVAEALQRGGVADDTLFIVTSDNGPLIGSTPRPGDPEGTARMDGGHRSAGGLRGYKAMIYDGGHREPFIARWPRAIRGGPGRAMRWCACPTCWPPAPPSPAPSCPKTRARTAPTCWPH